MKTFPFKKINFLLNGKKVELDQVNPKDLLIDYLRSANVDLTGTKLSCGEGGCGACTVLWSKYDPNLGKTIAIPINSCLRPLCSLDGTAITTIEGASASACGQMIESNMLDQCASQCGYCSPGFVMTMYSLLNENNAPTEQQVEDQFAGNICRCTGYISILNAMRASAAQAATLTAAPPAPLPAYQPADFEIRDKGDVWYHPTELDQVLRLMQEYQPVGTRAKIVQGNTSIGIYKADVENPSVFIDVSGLTDWKKIELTADGIALAGGVTIAELLNFLNENLDSIPTEWAGGFHTLRDHMRWIAGVQVRHAASVSGSLMMVKNHEDTDNPFPGDLFTLFMALNARVGYISTDGSTRTSLLEELPSPAVFRAGILVTRINLPYTGKDQLTFSYRVARRTQNSHPIVNCAFSCQFDAEQDLKQLTLVYGGIGHTAFKLKDTSALTGKWDETLLNTALPLIRAELLRATPFKTAGITNEYKIDLAVNLFIKFFAYVAAQTGVKVNASFASALDALRPLAVGDHQYFESPFYDGIPLVPLPQQKNVLQVMAQPMSVSPSAFTLTEEAPKALAVVGKEVKIGENVPRKIDAKGQVKGAAKYTHDLKITTDTLDGYFVYAQQRNAQFSYKLPIPQIRAELLDLFGECYYIVNADIPKPAVDTDIFNAANPSAYDPIFSDGNITCYGQPLGLIVAKDRKIAKEAAAYIQDRINYTQGALPEIPSLQVAIEKESKIWPPQGMLQIFRPLEVEDPDHDDKMKWMEAPFEQQGKTFVKGTQITGAQYHFYMEPQGALAIPVEEDQIEIYSATQNQASVQKRIAFALKIPFNKVRVGTTRLGGGFGGKELRQVYVAAAAAVAANKLQRPVRLLLDRHVDMQMVGTRHPFTGDFFISATKDGQIERMRVDYASDAGHSYDCSYPVMDLALLCAENAYYAPVFKTNGGVYRTNTQSRTAFRSFGLIQATLITEAAIERLAFELNMLPEDLRKKNFYPDDLTGRTPMRTPYGSPFKYGRINQIWDKLRKTIDFDTRLDNVRTFNISSKWKKRGISMIPLKYGISYTFRPMNQGSAYVFAYKEDGSVLLHHGGVEMGQGLHTKMAQVAAIQLGINIERIKIGATNTAIIPNVSSTGASTGSDLNGGAVKQACTLLKNKLVTFIMDAVKDPASFPDLTVVQIGDLKAIDLNDPAAWDRSWPTVIKYACIARIDVSAQFSFGSPQLGQLVTGADGNNQIVPEDDQIFYYYNNCVAASEVEVDILTGHYEILRSDIVYDAGDSLNDNIDIGQIEGGFVQGIGCLTTEEMLYAPNGRVISDGTWEYKPPCTKTIPQQFNVWLLKYVRSDDPTAPLKDNYGINSSKSTGEPPLVLANTVFFAIKHAIDAARKDQGNNDWFDLEAPATIERIQQACIV
ncbi:molybdopterin cofactor-binding domain-containing protein [Mucilaginibacter gossypii]|uniref:Xanthine dehydrogenase, molybdenum binding subunit apoprotein n=1 Tax=Mucilaginibacter gossypii TaxID=551996 RepID=A0A1G8CYC3_9SPHI|nr:molybdopterin cofactor-binding domain-containing protein [Mucilaginibacter gossypii]SDH50486.1 xanthine dehydrogenase, molybdenum binding subunit apoprotein [Mucilaginibacter gossypii]